MSTAAQLNGTRRPDAGSDLGSRGEPAGRTNSGRSAPAPDGPGDRVTPGRAGRVVHDHVVAQIAVIEAGDAALRAGGDPIHKTRVATRRLRSDVRVFADLFDAEAAAALDTELRWWAAELGARRDAQVQLQRHEASLSELPPELVLGPVLARLQNDLRAAAARALESLMVSMDGHRYAQLLLTLRRWRDDPPFAAAAAGGGRRVRQDARHADRRARARLRAASRPGAPDETLHRARKAAKRARYAAEAAGPAMKPRVAKRAVKRWRGVQELLGEHQDGTVAAALLRRLGAAAGGAPGENGFTFGLLWQREQDRATAGRNQMAKLSRQMHR